MGDEFHTQLAISQLEKQAKELLLNGIAPNSLKMYTSAQRQYLAFCHRLALNPLPASEDSLILFVTELAQTRAPSTVSFILSGSETPPHHPRACQPTGKHPQIGPGLQGNPTPETPLQPTSPAHYPSDTPADQTQPPTPIRLRQCYGMGSSMPGLFRLPQVWRILFLCAESNRRCRGQSF